MGCTLPRKPGVDYSDLAGGSTLTVRNAGGGVCGEYRLERSPRVSGEQMSVGPDASGWQSHLEDDQTATAVFRDCGLGQWQGPGAQRRLNLIAGNAAHQNDASQTWDETTSALTLAIRGAWATPNRPRCEAWYDAGPGQRIARIAGPFSSSVGSGFELFVVVSSDAVVSAYEASSDLYAGTSGSISFAPSARYRYAFVYWDYSTTAAGTDGASFPINVTPVVYGDTGLTVRGTEPNAGFYASDIVAYTLGRWAPKLNFTTGSDGRHPDVQLRRPATAFLEPTTPLVIVNDVSKYEKPVWGVWDNRTFYYHQPGARGRRAG